MGPCHSSVESTYMDLRTVMDRVADPYWANRGWVLHLFISWKKAKANSFAEGDQATRKGDRTSRYHQTRTTPERDRAHPAISMS